MKISSEEKKFVSGLCSVIASGVCLTSVATTVYINHFAKEPNKDSTAKPKIDAGKVAVGLKLLSDTTGALANSLNTLPQSTTTVKKLDSIDAPVKKESICQN